MAQNITQPLAFDSPTPAGIWNRSNRSLTIGLVMTVVGVAFEALAVATTLPATTRDLGGLALYGWAFSAFMLTNLIGITIAGAEADRYGPARPYLLGVALFVLGLLVAGAAPTMRVVVLGRAVQGFGAGFISSTVYVVIGRGYAEDVRPRMLAVTSTAWVVPGLIGPALAGLVTYYVGWRWVFLGLAPFPLVAAVLALPGMRRLARAGDAPRDWGQALAALRLAIGAGVLLTGFGVSTTWGWAYAGILIVAGAALGYPALRRLLPPGTLRAAPGLPAAVATHGLLNMAFFGVDAFIPLALTEVRGQTVAAAGLPLTAATLTWTTGAWIQAHFAKSHSRRSTAVLGLLIIILGIVLSIAVLSPAVPALLGPVAWGVAGLGIGLAFSTISLAVLETAPAGQEGTASSAMQLANMLGVALGTGIGGVIIGGAGGSATGTGGATQAGILIQSLLMIGVAALAVVVALRLPGLGKLAPQQEYEQPQAVAPDSA
jgi:MFS family permease